MSLLCNDLEGPDVRVLLVLLFLWALPYFNKKKPRLIVFFDGKSFYVLFDVTKVEKKDLFTGTYMPSTDLTGGYRILFYLDPS